MSESPLSVQQLAELRKVSRYSGVLAHWAFAPMCWALLHRRGFLSVEFVAGSKLRASVTDAGWAMLESSDHPHSPASGR